MSLEPLPWDRKDFFKERKHDRSSESFSGSVARWRDSPHQAPRNGVGDVNRWYSVYFHRPPDGDACSVGNMEPADSLSSNLAEKSPGVAVFSDCTSPATPSSVAYSSSPGGA